MTFENLYDQVTEHGDRDFIVYFQDEKKCAVTGTEYRKITDYFTSFLSEKLSGIEEKSWVALKSKNDPFWFAALFALLRLGYNVLMMDADADDVQTEAFRCQCGFKAIVADRECKCGDLPCITMNEIKESDKVEFCGKSRWSNKIGFCTSGTTGNAEIYVFSAEAICWQCENIAYFALNNKEITGSQLVPGMENNPILLTMPFRHCMGFGLSIYFWKAGSTVYLPSKPGIFGIVDTCRENNIWFASTVPAVWRAILQIAKARFGDYSSQSVHKLLGENLRFGISGGAKLDDVLAKRLIESGILFYNGWGMTEVGNVVIGNIASDESLDFSGRRYNFDQPERTMHEIKIRDTESGEIKDEGFGELVIRGKSMHCSTMLEGREIMRDAEEWFRTGDLFEKKGEKVYYKGRIKSVIINDTGENIYPEELDARFSFISDYQVQFCTAEYDNKPALYMSVKEIDDFSESECYKRICDVNYLLPVGMRISKIILMNVPLPVTSKGEPSRFTVKSFAEENNALIMPVIRKGR